MKEVLLILFNIICIVTIILMNKYRDTKTGVIIHFCWFAIAITIFFSICSHNFTIAQNIFMGFAGGAGIVYFFFNFKRISNR